MAFNEIPDNLRTGGVFTEFDSSRALQGTPAMPKRALLIVPVLSTGTLTDGAMARIFSTEDGDRLCGRGSIGSAMIAAFKRANQYMETWVVALADAAAATAASGTITVTVVSAQAGTIYLYIAGQRLTVGVAAEATAAAIATAIAAAITLHTELPVTATVGTEASAHIVTLTCRHKGTLGNAIDVRLNYHQGEASPAGVTLDITPMATGATDPDVAVALGAVAGDTQYHTCVTPWTADALLTVIEEGLAAAWTATEQKDGRVWGGLNGTLGELTDAGTDRNSPHSSLIGSDSSPTPPWIWATVVGAVNASETDPARPRKTLPLPGVLPPPPDKLWSRDERNTLLWSGISTFTVDPGGTVLIERLITTYQRNAAGLADPTYLDVTTMETLSYLRYAWNLRITTKYPRHKLAADGTDYAPDQPVMTPAVLKGEALAIFKEWERAALVEGREQFARDLTAAIDTTDPTRLNAWLVPDLIGQFLTLATQIQFRL